MRYPHTTKCRCGDCGKEGEKCDAAQGSHTFIRVMGNPYLSCMNCGRWKRQPNASDYESD